MKLKSLIRITILTLLLASSIHRPAARAVTIVVPDNSNPQVKLAAKEVRRYIYLRTHRRLPIERRNQEAGSGDMILVAPDRHPLVKRFRQSIGGHAPVGGFLLKSIETDDRRALIIAGDDSVSTLYGAYRFAEHLGVSFGLAQDVIPDDRIELRLSGFDEAGKPLLETRGILPFHDFPEGPDLWDTNDYMSVIGQLPKLGMNFFGLHTYPRWSTAEEKEFGQPQGPEPAVWIGLPQDVNEDGSVAWAYPAYWAHTHRPDLIWGFRKRDTSTFHAGASQVFDRDGYGSEVFQNGEMPTDLESSKGVFNRTGEMFDAAFTHARNLGVQTAVGTELPMGLEPKGPEVQYDWVRGMPPELQERLKSMGKSPRDPDVVKEVYQGIFKRIMKAHPLDYYWLWSWEVWSRYGVSEEQIAAFERDMQIAYEALQELDAPFELAHAGWIPGTDENPAEFDDALPSHVPFYGLWDQAMGFEEMSQERVKWAATWFEEDWGLIQPQFELTRIYKDVKAALEKGCDGLIAKHWRTRVLSMNVGAMKDLLWNYGPVGSSISDDVPPDQSKWMRDYYREWARQRFGPAAASSIASIFVRLDDPSSFEGGNFPGASGWDVAPGAIKPNQNDWAVEKNRYDFVEEFAALRPKIQGSGNQARFDYWLNTFKAFRLIARYGTLRHEFVTEFHEEEKPSAAMKTRIKMARLWEDLMNLEVQRITNESELGEIINLEVLNWYQLMMLQWDDELIERLGEEIPPTANPSHEYEGEPFVRVMPHRTLFDSDQPSQLSVIAMGDPELVTIHWRALGEEEFQSKPCRHVARSVYRASLPPQQKDFEYYIEATMSDGEIFFPPSAPDVNQTGVVMPGMSD